MRSRGMEFMASINSRQRSKIRFALIEAGLRHPRAGVTGIFGKPGRLFNPGRLAAIDIAENRIAKSGEVGAAGIGLQLAIKSARHLLDSSPHADVAATLFAQSLIETGENRINECLRQIGLTKLAQAIENEPGVKHQHVETSINRIRDAIQPVKCGLTRTARHRGVECRSRL